MAHSGLYLHIPFCRSRCAYCDFATGLYQAEAANRYVSALIHEIEQWHEVASTETIDTVYFGGGTPSLLAPSQVEQILNAVRQRFRLTADAELTMEMNPGTAGAPLNGNAHNLTEEKIATLCQYRDLGITRVSFGAQTFNDRELARLGRSHDAKDIKETFHNLRAAGFENVSLDLIAGLPGQTLAEWNRNLDEAFQLHPEHLSFYLLEVHEGTPLADHIRQGRQPQPNEDLAVEMYELMLERASSEGYDHYEISNLCRPGFESRHNSKYWLGIPYYGFGCSSHSYDGQRKRWSNERDLNRYIRLIENNASPIVESTVLSETEARAEAMFLRLRLMRGLSLDNYRDTFGSDLRESHRQELARFREAGLIELEGSSMRLTRQGALLSNEVFAAFV